MKIALCQINTTVGDLEGNLGRIRAAAARAAAGGADLAVFPELCLPGYPVWDLLEQEAFVDANLKALEALARTTGGMGLLVGFAGRSKSRTGKRLFNGAALLHKGKIAAVRAKTLLPTYDVFDEARYFEPAEKNLPIRWQGRRLGVSICEDAWNDAGFWPRRAYRRDPVAEQVKAGADVLINLSSSPYHRGKQELRRDMLSRRAKKAGRPLLYCNLAGGNDELIFDGHSLVFDAKGRLAAQGRAFEEDLVLVDLDKPGFAEFEELPDVEDVRRALVLGLRDYARKTGFTKVLLGLSGGIDSAVVCALAAEALGPANVLGVLMPSMHSSRGSVHDALALARNLGVRTLELPIKGVYDAFIGTLERPLGEPLKDLTVQNLQARIRGNLLMALSNQYGALLLSTGNKSELSMGYCTLYGDMSGGLAVIADVPKTLVYALARRFNEGRRVIPEASLTKPPSAELRPNQTDQDDLPPYDLLDRVIEAYVEEGLDVAGIAKQGVAAGLARQILDRIDRNEYKRRQAAPGLKITPKAFGIGRKMPLARGFHR